MSAPILTQAAAPDVKASVFDHPDVDLSTSVTRLDFPDVMGTPEVHLLANPTTDLILTPANARKAAANLLNAADLAEPLPVGASHIVAEDIRVGDEIDTPDGWQTAYMILVDARDQHVSIFTSERDDSYTDGWQHEWGDPLIVRRPQVGPRRRREVRR